MDKSNNSTFGDFSKKIKLDPSRQNLKPDPPGWTFEEKLTHALVDGLKALEAEEKAKKSVKTPSIPSQSESVRLENKLGETSTNVYARARTAVLNKLKPEAKLAIEKMERNEIPKDSRWDTFCKAVTKLGDDFSK